MDQKMRLIQCNFNNLDNLNKGNLGIIWLENKMGNKGLSIKGYPLLVLQIEIAKGGKRVIS